ncbi:MAG: HEPN domain-containing protein [Nanoarchaeota archaeon]
MREEIEHWWKQAENDLQKAEVLFKSENYDGVAFYSQQATEKALKAVILYLTKEKVVGHSLFYLGKQAKVPDEFLSELKKLSPQYFLSRYPDASEEIPYELYDHKIAQSFLEIAKKVLEWTKKQLK